jgi:hypothetical protein
VLYAVERLRNRGTTGSHRKGAPVTLTAAREDVEGDAAADDHLAAASVRATRTATTARGDLEADAAADDRLGRRGWGEAIGIGAAQILALLPGFSRSGATIAAGGLVRGLDHEDAARFAFLLTTPMILAAPLVCSSSRARRPRRQRHPRPGIRRQPGRRGRGLPFPTLPDPLLPHPHPDPVRHLLHPGRTLQPRMAHPQLSLWLLVR